MNEDDRIDAYLDELLRRLRGTAHDVRRTLSEAETHLHDAAARSIAAGVEQDDAQAQAIADFGTPAQLARTANGVDRGTSIAGVITAFASAIAGLAAVGFLAVGVSALVARVLALVTSTGFVYGAPANHTFTSADCVHWLQVQPGAASCTTAAALENSDDSFQFLIGGAILGLVIIGVFFTIRRFGRRRSQTSRWRLSRGVIAAVGATAFGGAGLVLLVAGRSDAVVGGVWGRGVWYVDAAVSLVAALAFLVVLIRDAHTLPRAVNG